MQQTRSIFLAKRLAPAMISVAFVVEAEGGEFEIRKDEKVGVVGEDGAALVRDVASISRAGPVIIFLECAIYGPITCEV